MRVFSSLIHLVAIMPTLFGLISPFFVSTSGATTINCYIELL